MGHGRSKPVPSRRQEVSKGHGGPLAFSANSPPPPMATSQPGLTPAPASPWPGPPSSSDTCLSSTCSWPTHHRHTGSRRNILASLKGTGADFGDGGTSGTGPRGSRCQKFLKNHLQLEERLWQGHTRPGALLGQRHLRLQAQTILISPTRARCHHAVIRDLAGSKEKRAFQSLVVLVLVPSLPAIELGFFPHKLGSLNTHVTLSSK